MKILALDLSTRSSGYSFGTNGVLQGHGIVTAASTDVIKRILKMQKQIGQIIQSNKIDKLIIQQVRPQLNSHTCKVLMWLQAAIILKAYEINPKIQYQFIGASSWRSKLSMKQGRGVKRDQAKLQDINYVKDKYNISVNDDEADAICIFDAYYAEDDMFNWG